MTLYDLIIQDELARRSNDNQKRNTEHQYSYNEEEIINEMTPFELLQVISFHLGEIK